MDESWQEMLTIAGTHVLAYGSRGYYPFTFKETVDMFEYHYWRLHG